MRNETYPLLQAQLGVFLDCQHAPDSTQYNVPIVTPLDGRVDLSRLERALDGIVAHRSVLRTRLSVEDGEVRQRADPAMTIPVVRVRLPDGQIDAYVRETFVRPFDLLGGEPLVRFAIVETEVRPYLLADFHHVIMDGSAVAGQFIARDLPAAYDGRELAESDYGVFEAAVDETASFQTPRYAEDRDFQRALMSGKTFATFAEPAAGEHPSPVFQATERLPQATCDAWCAQRHVRPNALFEAAFALVLSRFTRADSVAYTLEWHGRADVRVRTAYGMFVRPLPVVADAAGTVTVRELLDSRRAVFADVRSHATYPFTHLCGDANLVPGDSFNFIASAPFDVSVTLGGVRYPSERPLPLKSHEGLHCDIALENSDYVIRVLSCVNRNSPESLRRIARAIRATVENMMDRPEARLAEISTVGADETANLLSLGTGAKIDYDTSETFVDLFLKHAQATPEAKAVVAANGTLTYGELDAQSSALAAKLVEKGVKPGDFVAVKLGRVKEFPLAVIAIWKAGAAYVPVDPEYPEERIAYMLEDSGAKVVVDEAFLVDASKTVVLATREHATHGSVRVSHAHHGEATPASLAYMIYTSGSTGKPKGVMVSHANLRAFLAWLPDELGLQPGEAVAEHASFSFDASICDLYTSLSRGVTLHILSSELRKDLDGLAKYLADNKIVGATLSTQLGMELLNACDLKLRYMVLGGEKLKHVKKTSVRLYNGYGPTEFTCWSSHHVVDQEKDGEDIPIGKAVPNTLSAIVDKAGNLLPRGMVGELVLAGAQLSRGYWKRPELTKERFAALPWMEAGRPVVGPYQVKDQSPRAPQELSDPSGRGRSPSAPQELSDPPGRGRSPSAPQELSDPSGRGRSPSAPQELSDPPGRGRSPSAPQGLSDPPGRVRSPSAPQELSDPPGRGRSPSAPQESSDPSGRGRSPSAPLAYRTGDLARWDENGELIYCGRIDNQVKLRGFRIEMGEIESAMAKFPGIAAAVADVKKVNGVDRLVGYYVVVRVTHAHASTGEGVLVGHEHYGEELRAFLSQSLAEYMVPDAFVCLETLPLTPNGKVDRKRLPLPELQGAAYVAPEGATERSVATVMADVLGIQDPVGRDDDFLALGGDSIKSIRLVSKLRAVGVTVTVADIMKAKTVKGIAACAKSEDAFAVDTSDWSGEVPLTAIQETFFNDWKLARPAHFNQSMMLSAAERLDADRLHRALDALARHHDMLRAVYADNVQRVRAVEGEGPLFDLTVIDGDGKDLVARESEAVQASFDLAKGPLLKAALFRGKKTDHLLLVVHHLVVDGVSWRILLEDLESAYSQLGGPRSGADVTLPPKAMSFRDWRAAVGRYAESHALRRELSYWRDVDAKVSAVSPATVRGAGARDFTRSLDAQPFAALTGAASRAYNTEVNDLLLAALGRAYAQVTGNATLAVELEGHGREPIHEETRIDRTVGWFTSVYPVVIETSDDLPSSIRHVKETLRRVPNHGLGYGILRHVFSRRARDSRAQVALEGARESRALRDSASVPPVSFNYLGSFAEGDARGVFAFEENLPHGQNIATENVFGSAMAVNCWGAGDGTLQILFSHDPTVWDDVRAAAFADAFVVALRSVVRHTLAVKIPERTASDLGETVWSDAEFRAVEFAFAARGETLERIYPLMPMQESMLLAAVSHPESAAYHLASRVALDALPGKDALERAVARLLEKHEVLRTAIVHEDVCEPRQAIVRGRALPVSFVDVSGEMDPDAAAADLERRAFESAVDLQDDPLFRIVCIKTSASAAVAGGTATLPGGIAGGTATLPGGIAGGTATLPGGIAGRDGVPSPSAETACQLLFVVHHIIVDGWCIGLYLGDLMRFLRAEVDGTATREDFSARAGRYERHVRDVAVRDRSEALAYWRGLLDGYETKAEVPAYETVTEANRASSNEVKFELSAETTARLAELCRAAGCTVNNAVEAAWGLLLQKCTRTDDVVFVKVVSGRDSAAENVADTVGIFINSVPVRVRTQPDMSLRDLAAALQRQAVETSAHDWAPLADIQGTSALGSDLFQSILAFENYEAGAEDGKAPPFGMRVVSVRETNVAEIALSATLGGERLGINLKFDADKYTAVAMTRLMKAFERLLCAFAEAPDQKACAVSLLDDAEAADLIALGTGAKIDYDTSETFVDLFLKHAKATPEAKAVVAANGTLTYGELDAQSSALAAKLVEKGVKPGDFVAVKLARVKEFPLAVIAIWKAGAAYVPVDPEYPEERIAYMLEDSGAKVVVDEAFLVDASKTVVLATREHAAHGSVRVSHAHHGEATPALLAYMIYTSGSTGKPKGAMVSHANLRAFLAWLTDELGLQPGEAIAEHASFSFDASICDLYTSLTRGVTLHILSSELRKDLDGLAKYLADNKIVGATFSTQLGMEFLNACDLKLRYMILGGEKLKHVRKTSVRLYNAYGPTEFTCVSSYHVVDQERDGEDIPIGRAVPNTLSAIVDKSGNLLPRGMVGELVLAGAQLGRGYWKRPELTKERFAALPWMEAGRPVVGPYQVKDQSPRAPQESSDPSGRGRSPSAPQTLVAPGRGRSPSAPQTLVAPGRGRSPSAPLAYRTGDLARWDENGELIYCGRIDTQVKLRGFRIEMGEIESAMAKFPGIAAAVADVKKVNGVDRLVGYYVEAVAKPGRDGVPSLGLRLPSKPLRGFSAGMSAAGGGTPALPKSAGFATSSADEGRREKGEGRRADDPSHSNNQTIKQSNIDSLRAFLSQSLTEYMVPDAFVCLESLPMTPNGKVDRKRLPLPEIKADEIVPPATEQETALFEVVAAELKMREFGVTTNLISLGLTSLRAIRLSAALKKATGLVISTGDILAKPRIRDWTKLAAADVETIAVLPPQETYPLTANQLGVYLDWARNRTGLQYNVPSALRFEGVDAEKLRAAVTKAVAAHPYFKVHLEERDGAIVQVRRDGAALDVRFEKLDREIDAAFFQSRTRPFDLLKDDLARFEVYAASDAAYLFLDVHHILYDGGSAGVFLQAVQSALVGGEPDAEQASAYDYALHDAAWQKSEACAKAETYFADLVADTESFLYPPARSGASATGKSAVHTLRIPLAAIRTKCRELSVTPNAFFATALCETLRRVSRTDDVQIATVSNGRSLAQLANTVGMFVETLPLVDRKRMGSAAEAIRAMQSEIAETLCHDRYPFTKLVERHGLKPNVLYVFQGGVVDLAGRPVVGPYQAEKDQSPHIPQELSDPSGRGRSPSAPQELSAASGRGRSPSAPQELSAASGRGRSPSAPEMLSLALDTAKVPLALSVIPRGDECEFVFEYDAGLYGADEIATLAKSLATLAATLAEQSCEVELSSVPLVGADEMADLLALGTGETLDYDRNETLVDLFLKHAKATPEAKAVVAANGTLTYGELDAQSSALAAKLVREGVKPGDFVAVKLGRVKEFPLAVIAIWKAGAAYVPVDPEYPADRIAYMLEDSGAKVVVDEAFLVDASKTVVLATREHAAHGSVRVSHAHYGEATPASLAYMIYTSGSTGKPKGVMVTHANLRAFVAWRVGVTGAQPGEAFAHYTSFSFDASLDDLATPLAAGSTIHILSESVRLDMDSLRRYLADNAIVGLTLPTQFGMQLLNGDAPRSLRYLMMGGEKLKPTKESAIRIINGYGPTEFTVCSSYHIVDPAKDGEDIPIGKAVPNTLSAIVDKAGNLLPRGMVGELVLAGAQLSRGYWKRPELTKERFAALPWMEAGRPVVGPYQVKDQSPRAPQELSDPSGRGRSPSAPQESSDPSGRGRSPSAPQGLSDPSGRGRSPSAPLAYRTGDLARWDENGELIYCGRIDNQVKLRGFRIEMGEIESAMAKFPGIAAAVADVKKVNGVDRLVGYYVEAVAKPGRDGVPSLGLRLPSKPLRGFSAGMSAAGGGTPALPKSAGFATSSVGEGRRADDPSHSNNQTIKQSNIDSLRAFLAQSLAEYMVPDAFVCLESLPMTPNGKVDRKRLPVPDAESLCGDYVEPATDDERALCAAYGRVLELPRYGAETDFFQAGGSSLDGIGLVAELQHLGFKVVYGDLFKYKTPRALAAFLGGGGQGLTALPAGTFSSFDYAPIDALLAKTRTDLFDGFVVRPLGNVLLTGATGYLGIHVLRYLLEHTSSNVTVLLRPKGKAGPERRLDAQYVYYYGERLPDRFRNRIAYVAGDITSFPPSARPAQSNTSTTQQSNNLPDISTVLNCAALVKHYSADDALDRVNVRGVENLLAWCAETGARFVQTSTYSVGGAVDATASARLDERHLFVGQDSDNDYVRTKFLAERAVLSAVAAGKVRAKIMRLGNLMGREEDGEFQMNVGANAFVNSLKSYAAIGAYPLDELATPLEMSPIDRVAEAVCLLATTPDDMVVFHPYNAYALDMGAVLGALNRRGHAVDYTSRAEFAARVDALKADPSRAEDLQGILHYAQRHLDGRKMTPVANGWTTTVLYRLGFRWKPAEDRYLANFFDMLDGLAVFG